MIRPTSVSFIHDYISRCSRRFCFKLKYCNWLSTDLDRLSFCNNITVIIIIIMHDQLAKAHLYPGCTNDQRLYKLSDHKPIVYGVIPWEQPYTVHQSVYRE